MATVLEERHRAQPARGGWQLRAAILAGLALLYVPTFVDLARGLWRDDAYAHGPLILGLAAFLAWRERAALAACTTPAPRAGLALVAVGLAMWLLGRTQALMPIEAASLLPLAAGLALLLWGTSGLRRLAFPLAFLAFYVPLPGFVLDTFTTPLKERVSAVVAQLLAQGGYAVERSGVVLAVEGHEMLVADACSGLNSIVSLLALGLLYGHLSRASSARMAILVLALVPIALLANVLRVLALVLIAAHAGPDAAQGWIHDALGLAVFVVALLLLLAFDRLLPRKRVSDTKFHATPGPLKMVSDTIFPAVAAGVLMAAVAAAAPALRPTADANAAFDLEAAIPAAFASWHVDAEVAPIAPAPDVQANLARLYRQIVSRTYVNAQGERMMLTVAHGGDQSDALKAHRQEVCYRAQGFEVRALEHATLAAAGREIPVTRFVALRGERSEPVTYWFTMGDQVVLGRLERLRVQLANGLRGRVPDGLLVRVSSLDADPLRAHGAQGAFVAALAPAADTTRLVGAPPR